VRALQVDGPTQASRSASELSHFLIEDIVVVSSSDTDEPLEFLALDSSRRDSSYVYSK
jgi:hypothetical protein